MNDEIIEMEMAVVIRDDQARLNITWQGQNGDLPDPVPWDGADGDLKQMAAEAIQTGYIPGIEADANVNFTDFVVDRFASNDEVTFNRLSLRPKTPLGEVIC